MQETNKQSCHLKLTRNVCIYTHARTHKPVPTE